MRFYRPKRTLPAVPIVALIDILAILLIFITLTTQERKKRTVLPITFPVVEAVATDQVVETRSILAVAADGRITLDALLVPDGLLVDYLKAMKNIHPDRKLEMEADQDVSFKQLISVWDALTKAGFKAKLPTRVNNAKTTNS